MQILGHGIRTRRHDLGLDQAELARLIGVTQQTVSRWEKGDVVPPPKRLAALASVLDLKLDRLLSLAGYFEADDSQRSSDAPIEKLNVAAASEEDLYLFIDLVWGELRRRRAQGSLAGAESIIKG